MYYNVYKSFQQKLSKLQKKFVKHKKNNPCAMLQEKKAIPQSK